MRIDRKLKNRRLGEKAISCYYYYFCIRHSSRFSLGHISTNNDRDSLVPRVRNEHTNYLYESVALRICVSEFFVFRGDEVTLPLLLLLLLLSLSERFQMPDDKKDLSKNKKTKKRKE